MTEKRLFKPVGGVAHAELFAVGGLTSAEDLEQGRGLAVDLTDDGSHYHEEASADNLPVSVQHSLTLCSTRWQATEWFDADFLAHASADGVVARIGLCSGESIVVGWSQRFGFEQPLRLRSLHFNSGSHANDSPRVELTLTSCDTCSAFDK